MNRLAWPVASEQRSGQIFIGGTPLPEQKLMYSGGWPPGISERWNICLESFYILFLLSTYQLLNLLLRMMLWIIAFSLKRLRSEICMSLIQSLLYYKVYFWRQAAICAQVSFCGRLNWTNGGPLPVLIQPSCNFYNELYLRNELIYHAEHLSILQSQSCEYLRKLYVATWE